MMARPVHPVTLVSKQLAQHIARVRKRTTGQREEKKTRARPVAETRRQTHSRMFLCFCRQERWSTVTEELGGSLRSAGTLQETKWGPAPLMDQYVPAGPEGCRFFSSQSLTISLLSPVSLSLSSGLPVPFASTSVLSPSARRLPLLLLLHSVIISSVTPIFLSPSLFLYYSFLLAAPPHPPPPFLPPVASFVSPAHLFVLVLLQVCVLDLRK